MCDAYSRRAENDYKDEWERVRVLAAISVQPHVRKRVTPAQLLPLPWDKPEKPAGKAPAGKEESLKRFERLAGRRKNPPPGVTTPG